MGQGRRQARYSHAVRRDAIGNRLDDLWREVGQGGQTPHVPFAKIFRSSDLVEGGHLAVDDGAHPDV